MEQCLAIYQYCKVDEMKIFQTNVNVHVARNSTVGENMQAYSKSIQFYYIQRREQQCLRLIKINKTKGQCSSSKSQTLN